MEDSGQWTQREGIFAHLDISLYSNELASPLSSN
jgi:hypothetical protein